MTYETLLVEKADGVAVVTFNRPEKKNAMNPRLHDEMTAALEALRYDDEARVLVITGAGNAFCAGMDLKEVFHALKDQPARYDRVIRTATEWRGRTLRYYPKPTIAMVNGFCFGGAFTHVIACDLAIAADDATFGLSEVNWGIIPGGIVSWNVADLLNFRNAMYYAMTGDAFDGKIAAQIGLVNYSVPKAELRAETIKLARKLMEKNPMALRYTKEAIRAVRSMSEAQADNYLSAKSDALRYRDPEKGRDKALSQFVDDKAYRPGLGPYDRERAKKS
jgi:trans-feruloyl-CoA hydratase/vanillin synthase